MNWVKMLLVIWVSAAIGDATGLLLVRVIGFANAVLVCVIAYGTAIIGTLIVFGVIITLDYIKEREQHRIVMTRLHNLGLPK